MALPAFRRAVEADPHNADAWGGIGYSLFLEGKTDEAIADFRQFIVLSKNNDLIEIFNNELSEKFRSEVAAGNCPTCKHCAWKNNKNYTPA